MASSNQFKKKSERIKRFNQSLLNMSMLIEINLYYNLTYTIGQKKTTRTLELLKINEICFDNGERVIDINKYLKGKKQLFAENERMKNVNISDSTIRSRWQEKGRWERIDLIHDILEWEGGKCYLEKKKDTYGLDKNCDFIVEIPKVVTITKQDAVKIQKTIYNFIQSQREEHSSFVIQRGILFQLAQQVCPNICCLGNEEKCYDKYLTYKMS